MGIVIIKYEACFDGKVASHVPLEGFLEEFNLPKQILLIYFEMVLWIKGVEVSVLLKEVEEGVKASLRSKNDVDVRKVAEILVAVVI